MRKIQDRIVAGVIAGLGANLVKQAIERSAVMTGISKRTAVPQAAGFFLPKRKVNKPLGDVLGVLADNSIAAGLGVFESYLFTFTGSDHPVIKGMAIGHLTWTASYGVLAKLGASSVKPKDPPTQLVSWLAHTAFGISKGLILRAITDPRVFRPHYRSLGEPIDPTFEEVEQQFDQESVEVNSDLPTYH